jgi:molecular chaperone GrpE
MSNNTNKTAVKGERRKGNGNGAEQVVEEAPPSPEGVAQQPEEPVAAEGAGVGGEAEPAESPEVRQLRADLETARRRVDELARAYQALNKEREEYKQRLARERERLLDVERGNVALTLLEAIDEMDRCLAASANDGSPLAQGVRLIRDGLLSKVNQTGIERLVVVGKPFDPNVAEAADMEVTTSPEEDQKVVAELRAGYQLKDRVIRPARVKVAKYVAPAQA